MDQLKYSEETQRIIQTYGLGREYLWEWVFKEGVFIIFIKPTYTINIIKINVETNS